MGKLKSNLSYPCQQKSLTEPRDYEAAGTMDCSNALNVILLESHAIFRLQRISKVGIGKDRTVP